MGSSDLSKVCTKGVILAPSNHSGDFMNTYFYFPKFRGFSTPSQYLFSCPYDVYSNSYLPSYTIASFKFNGKKFKFTEHLVDPEELSWLG
jgi:hypothetical protein